MDYVVWSRILITFLSSGFDFFSGRVKWGLGEVFWYFSIFG